MGTRGAKKTFAPIPTNFAGPTVESRGIYQAARKSASPQTSAESSWIQGKRRRQKIDHRSNEAKAFYVARRSRNCLNEGRGILETISGFRDG
jgi:hypothetical protein